MPRGLSNQDFRVLMMTPRSTPAVGTTPGGGGGATRATPSRGRGGPKPGGRGGGGGGGGGAATGEGGGGGEGGAQQQEEDDDAYRKRVKSEMRKKQRAQNSEKKSAGYRDRAAERRQNDNPDFVGDTQILSTMNPPAPGVSEVSVKKLTVEQSKYLGGDEAHTHLVKGLDFVLLQKKRKEMEEREKDTPEQRKPLPEPTPAIAMHSPMARRVYKILFSAPLITSFNTSDNTSVATAATIQAHQQDQHDQSHTLDFFIGGRMVYHFPVDERAPDMPTTIISSKTTAAQDEAMMTGRIDNNIMDKILKVMTSLRVAPKGRRRRKDKESPTMTPTKPPPTTVTTPTISAPLDNEDSIFPDVGDYIFSTKDKEDSSKAPTSTTSTPTQPVAPPKSYFERSTEEAPAPTDPKATASLILAQARVMSLDLESQNPNQNQSQNKNPDPANQSSGSHPPTAERTKPTALLPTPNLPQTSPPPSSPQKDLNTPKQTTKASPGGAPPQASHHNQPPSKPDPTKLDPYFECYPGAFESTSFGADSDEDEDVSKMDQGPKGKNRLKRWDFDTEEGWEKYNQTREAMPRAAFQFGVKMADGRKTRKQKEAKLDKDMKKINDLIKVMAQTENSMEAAITDPTTSSMRLRAHEDGENENEDDPSQPRKRLRL